MGAIPSIQIPGTPGTVYSEWGQDLVLTPSGQLQTATGWDQIRQRIERRLLTDPSGILPDGTPLSAEYIFHPDYGEGLQNYVGQDVNESWVNNVRKCVLAATRVDSGVEPDTLPQVSFQQTATHTVLLLIIVTLISGETGTIALEVS
jgi:phage baseplate assembly protein W